MKKLFAVLLSIVLVLSMGTVALAADAGSITITNAVDGADYEIYKMLDFAPSNAAGDKGIYKIVAGWEDFFAAAPATDYFTVVTNADQTTVVLKDGVTEVDQTLAKAAIAYAEANGIDATETKAASGSTVEFTGLALGYYAIDTSLGTLCALTNTNSDFTAAEKNEKPDIDKFVQEDSEINNADEGWGKVNDADIGQVVNYKSTITVGVGATNYVMHDTMDAGLTFNADSIVVEGATKDVDYTVTTPCDDGCTFEIAFKDEYIAGLAKGTKIIVCYSATLNENAKVAYEDPANDGYTGNKNTVYLAYGEDHTWTTKEHETVTYTWNFDVLKFTKDGENKVELAGAKFELQYNGNAIELVALGTTDVEIDGATVAVPTYRVAKDGETGTVEEIVTDATGRFIIEGLDADSYQLVEKEAPDGYNKLANPIDVVIKHTFVETEGNLSATYNFEVANENGEIETIEPTTFEVENKTGGLFPETGGIGTTIFYVVGALLMLAAVVILVSKKRMATFA